MTSRRTPDRGRRTTDRGTAYGELPYDRMRTAYGRMPHERPRLLSAQLPYGQVHMTPPRSAPRRT
ncbi:hypothetical protein P8605_21505 [Streptomyces sp. T-3]|nr:hypothetical protein [Streptomyces sp. T-3]